MNMSAKKTFFHVFYFLSVTFWGMFLQCSGKEIPLYKFVMKDAMDADVSLSEYKGKVSLHVCNNLVLDVPFIFQT